MGWCIFDNIGQTRNRKSSDMVQRATLDIACKTHSDYAS